MRNSIILSLGLIIICSLYSCSTNKNIAYFKNVPDSIYNNAMTLETSEASAVKIKPDDILSISIQSIDPELNNVMGTTNEGLALEQINNQQNNRAQNGVLVDKEGFIELPLAGRIRVADLTTSQVRDEIKKRALPYYKDPVVNVRLANFKITVLGEVNKPGTYIMPNENVSILDAVGMAGDLTIYAKRENVLLIRKESGKKDFVRFNFNSSEMFNSPYFTLHQGDVIYVEPNKAKIATTDGAKARTYSLLAAGASVLIVLLTRL